MKIAHIRQSASAALAVLLISGAGIAFAANPPSSVPSTAPTVAPVTTPATEPTTASETTAEPTGAAEPTGTEKAGVEEPGDASLPGGGHADDPANASADNQCEGVQ